MPDIQTAMRQALQKTLVEWDDDDAPPLPSVQPVSSSVSAPSQNVKEKPMSKNLFPIRNNVTRATFNYIKENPGSKRKEIITALDHMGFKEASTSSIMSQLIKNKMGHKTNGLYYIDVDEYIPIKNPKTVKKAMAKATPIAETRVKRKYTKRDTTGIGALLQAKLEAAPNRVASHPVAEVSLGAKRATTIIRSRTPEDIVNNMTVYEARALYIHLKQLFGG